MHWSWRQFARFFRFPGVLLREILWPVVRYLAHPIKNALMDMDTVWNQPGAPQVNRDTALPLGRSLSRHGHRIEKTLWPEFAQPPDAVQRFMQLSLGIWRDVRSLAA